MTDIVYLRDQKKIVAGLRAENKRLRAALAALIEAAKRVDRSKRDCNINQARYTVSMYKLYELRNQCSVARKVLNPEEPTCPES